LESIAAARLLWLGWLAITGLRKGAATSGGSTFMRSKIPSAPGAPNSASVIAIRRQALGCDLFSVELRAISYLPLFDMDAPVVISCRGSQINIAPMFPAALDFATTCARRSPWLQTFIASLKPSEPKRAITGSTPHGQRSFGRVNPEFFYRRQTAPMEVSHCDDRKSCLAKGHEYALMSIRQLVDSGIDVQFDIIGDGLSVNKLDTRFRTWAGTAGSASRGWIKNAYARSCKAPTRFCSRASAKDLERCPGGDGLRTARGNDRLRRDA